jgi:hypothetical protein
MYVTVSKNKSSLQIGDYPQDNMRQNKTRAAISYCGMFAQIKKCGARETADASERL